MPLKKYNFRDVHGHHLEQCQKYQDILSERDAAVRERDAAVGALRFYADSENYKYPESGDLVVLQDDGSQARAALAKIEGERNG